MRNATVPGGPVERRGFALNTQPILKADYHGEGLLTVHHLFATLQGEGPFAGDPAVFVRLWGCNLQCPMCDTDYSSQSYGVRPGVLLKEIGDITPPNKFVVFSGGEPLRQNIVPAIRLLLSNGYTVQVETNGTLFPQSLAFYRHARLTFVCSPKAGKINKDFAQHIGAYKYVLSHYDVDPEDGLPLHALGHPAKPKLARPHKGFTGPVYLQPADENDTEVNQKNLEACLKSCMKYGYRLGLQTHKLIGLE